MAPVSSKDIQEELSVSHLPLVWMYRKTSLQSVSHTANSLYSFHANDLPDSETAKAMMPDYHIGTLDKASLEALKNNSTSDSNEPRPVFLQSRAWTKATLCEKKNV